jgi:hypothetical protein
MDRDHEDMEVRAAGGGLDPEEVRALYEELPPEERRERIVLCPSYRTFYNELVQPDEMVGFPGSAYFWKKWVSILKPTAASVYIVLRNIAYAHKNLPEDARCYPDQAELARMLGLSDRKTIREHLNTLESYGFLKREKDYRGVRDQEHGGRLARQKTSVYHVFYEIPLVAEDAVTLLLAGEGISNVLKSHGFTSVGENPPHRYGGKPSTLANQVEGNPPPTPSYPQAATSVEGFSGGKPPSINVRRSNVLLTLDNVREQSSRKKIRRATSSTFQEDPRVSSLSPLERAKKEELVREIARTLNGCKGDHGNEDHKSAGFHRRVAYFMPDHLVHQALMTVRDMHYDANVAGSKQLGDAGAYFAGVVRKMAEQEGIPLDPVGEGRS